MFRHWTTNKILTRVFEIGMVVTLIAALVFLSVARTEAMEKAAEQAALIRDHKDNEERLTNELAAAIQQKNDIEKELIAALNIEPEIIEVEVIKEVEVPAPTWSYEYTQEDIDILAAVMYGEEHPDRYEMMLAGSVVLNRVKDPRFPDTIKEVVYQIDGPFEQYAPRTKGFIGKELPEECYRLAEILLRYGPIAPGEVIYQAHFNQGEVFWSWQGEEFCFGR